MSSNSTTADVDPEEVMQAASSDDDAGDLDGTNHLAEAELTVSGGDTSDVTSAEYSTRIQELSEQVQTLRASIATALQERSDAEAQESLYGKRLDAVMSKSSTLKKDLRTSEMERIQLRDNLEQLEVVLQSESCSMTEHALIKEELVELSNQHKQLEKQHKQQAVMLAEFQTENATLEVRLSNMHYCSTTARALSHLLLPPPPHDVVPYLHHLHLAISVIMIHHCHSHGPPPVHCI